MKIVEIKKILNEIKALVRKEYKAEILGIFGSYVRGEEKDKSDLDILVRFLEGASLLDLAHLCDFLEEKLGISARVVPIDTVRKEIKARILEETVYL